MNKDMVQVSEIKGMSGVFIEHMKQYHKLKPIIILLYTNFALIWVNAYTVGDWVMYSNQFIFCNYSIYDEFTV